MTNRRSSNVLVSNQICYCLPQMPCSLGPVCSIIRRTQVSQVRITPPLPKMKRAGPIGIGFFICRWADLNLVAAKRRRSCRGRRSRPTQLRPAGPKAILPPLPNEERPPLWGPYSYQHRHCERSEAISWRHAVTKRSPRRSLTSSRWRVRISREGRPTPATKQKRSTLFEGRPLSFETTEFVLHLLVYAAIDRQ